MMISGRPTLPIKSPDPGKAGSGVIFMEFFHGTGGAGPYFEGWYFKHQTPEGQGLALIPAFHRGADGRTTASLQVIAKDKSWWLEYPAAQLQFSRRPLQIRLGQSVLGERGLDLHIQREGLSLRGSLGYGPLTPLKSDIMGPFRLLGGMQCSHGVVSMGHRLTGALELNGERLDLTGGLGYMETDRGRSFPDAYLWTQCLWDGPGRGSLMLAVATIPLPVGGFTGCICSVLYGGREYRLATYRGACIEKWSPAGAVIRRGGYRLEVKLLSQRRQPLRAPTEGKMERTIHESLCARVGYRFWRGDELLFQRIDPNASFEYSAVRPANRGQIS